MIIVMHSEQAHGGGLNTAHLQRGKKEVGKNTFNMHLYIIIIKICNTKELFCSGHRVYFFCSFPASFLCKQSEIKLSYTQ